jgi:hypothetical protein
LPTDAKMQLAKLKEIKQHTKRVNYTGKIKLEGWEEHALGACKSKDDKGLDLRFLMPRFKHSEYSLRVKIHKSDKPMIILFITIDSFSRRHFYRKLPQTLDFLHNLYEYDVFDFKLHNIIGTDTAENQLFVFADIDYEPSWWDTADNLGKAALWRIMQDRGFMTLWSTDGCASNVPRVLGTSPDVDHVVGSFFCANKQFSAYTADKFHTYEQRCLGPHMSHSYLMNYSLAFSQNYKAANQWIYNHFTAAHEASGQHAQTLDADLADYLAKYIEKYNSTHEIVVLINGDHGMRYGGFMTETESNQEFKLPACFIIASKTFLKKINARENLLHNSFRLSTKTDLRQSMIFLADYQDGRSFQKEDKRTVNLFGEKVMDNRTCEEAGIVPWLCAGHVMKQFGELGINDENWKLVREIQEAAVLFLNSEIYAKNAQSCRTVLSGQIKNVFYKDIQSNKLIRFTFYADNALEAQIIVWAYLSKQRIAFEKKIKDLQLPSFPILYLSSKYFCKITYLSTLDPYPQLCDSRALKFSLPSGFCLC